MDFVSTTHFLCRMSQDNEGKDDLEPGLDESLERELTELRGGQVNNNLRASRIPAGSGIGSSTQEGNFCVWLVVVFVSVSFVQKVYV